MHNWMFCLVNFILSVITFDCFQHVNIDSFSEVS